jgi:hypothetical protein
MAKHLLGGVKLSMMERNSNTLSLRKRRKCATR